MPTLGVLLKKSGKALVLSKQSDVKRKVGVVKHFSDGRGNPVNELHSCKMLVAL
jgi:hypothetical protein